MTTRSFIYACAMYATRPFGRLPRCVAAPKLRSITKAEFMERAGVGPAYRASLKKNRAFIASYEPTKTAPTHTEVVPAVYPQAVRPQTRICPDVITHQAWSKPSRPAAIKRNGGLRGSTATRW